MIYDVKVITSLCNDILFLRERLVEEIATYVTFDKDLADNVMLARDALNEVYKKLDKHLLESV